MWKVLVIVLVLACIGLVISRNNEQIGGNSSLYYQQHSRYPWGSWWIPFSEPSQACHKQARIQCPSKYFYDDCYDQVLSNCHDSCPPKDLLAWGNIRR